MEQLRHKQRGFTLIELSIVLVIIGLIVGGVLVGQDLIKAAQVRATITQIEKYNTAVNTFRGKYNALPGDMDSATATSFGFPHRGNCGGGGNCHGMGDGNGVIEGWSSGWGSGGTYQGEGETTMVWVDLTTANGLNINLIDGSFSTATEDVSIGTVTNMDLYLPQAKLGQGNYIYVFSNNSRNYFGILGTTSITAYVLTSNFALTVQQAYNIDKKTDDGYPQTGNITAQYALNNPAGGGVGWVGAADTSATARSATTCYDNNNSAGAMQQYSLAQNGGAGVNCALSIQFQ